MTKRNTFKREMQITWVAGMVLVAGLHGSFTACQAASPSSANIQEYWSHISPVVWPKEVPPKRGMATFVGLLDWLDTQPGWPQSRLAAGFRQLARNSTAETLSDLLKEKAAIEEMDLAPAIALRRGLGLVLAATAEKGLPPNFDIFIHLYAAHASPLLEARVDALEFLLAAVKNRIVLGTGNRDMDVCARRVIDEFDADLAAVIGTSDDSLTLDQTIALRRLAAGHLLSKRCVLAVIAEYRADEKAGWAIDPLTRKLESRQAEARLDKSTWAVLIEEANYVARHIDELRSEVKLRREISPVIVAYLEAISAEDIHKLEGIMTPGSLIDYRKAASLRTFTTNNAQAKEITLWDVKSITSRRGNGADVEVGTVVTETSGDSYPRQISIEMTRTEAGWKIGRPSNDERKAP